MMGPAFGYMPGHADWMMIGSYVFWLAVVLALVVVIRLARPTSG
jgi:uncharacterized membrane protein